MAKIVNDKSERYELSRLGARPVKNSGRGLAAKGDGIIDINSEPFLTVDVKEYGKGYRITPENWAKLSSDALQNRTFPCLDIVLGEDEPRLRIVAISESTFKELLNYYIEGHTDNE